MAKYTATLMDVIQSELQKSGHNEFINNGKLTFDNSEYQFIQKVMHFDDDVKNIVDRMFFKGFRFNNERIDRYFKQAFVTRFLDREINRQTVEAFAIQVLHYTIIREDYIYRVFGDEVYKYLENHVDYKADQIGNTIEDVIQNQTNEQKQNQNSEEKQNNKQNETDSRDTHSDSTNISDNRELTTSLPQSEVNLNVDNTQLAYGDTNTISKTKTTNEMDEETNGQRDTTGEVLTNGTQDTITNGVQDSTSNTNQDRKSNQKSLTKTYLLENLEKIYNMRERLFDDYDKKCFLQIW